MGISLGRVRHFPEAHGSRHRGTDAGRSQPNTRYSALHSGRGSGEELQVAALDRELAWLGGDPLHDDTGAPSRCVALGREGVWSDWLAHLLASGDTELLRRLLLAPPQLPSVAPQVHRERELLIDPADRAQGNYRSDIIVEWTEPMLGIHIEVKARASGFSKRPGLRRGIFRPRTEASGTTFSSSCRSQKRDAHRMKGATEAPKGIGAGASP